MTAGPYRREPTTRFALTVNGELFEGDCFKTIIRCLRERGHGEGVLLLAAIAATKTPRGASLDVIDG